VRKSIIRNKPSKAQTYFAKSQSKADTDFLRFNLIAKMKKKKKQRIWGEKIPRKMKILYKKDTFF
jgi:hypothetical protein